MTNAPPFHAILRRLLSVNVLSLCLWVISSNRGCLQFPGEGIEVGDCRICVCGVVGFVAVAMEGETWISDGVVGMLHRYRGFVTRS